MSSATASVSIDLDRVIGTISPQIYGQFLSRRRWVVEEALFQPGHEDADEHGIRTTVADAVRELAPPVIRWPGGCTGTSYEWERGVGDPSQRSRTIDWHFGYDVGNGFGTAEFVAFCRSVGAEPQINLTTGTGTLREALGWLEYANGTGDSHYANLRRQHGYDEPFDVRYWQIGNEDWGEWEIGRVSAAEHARRCREWARALHKLEPRVNVLATGAWRSDLALDWNIPLLREAWDELDYLTVHTYWRFDPTLPDGDYDRLIGAPDAEEDAIVAMRGLIDLVGRERGSDHRPLLAFTEWNCADLTHQEMTPQWRPGHTQYRLLDALVCAAFLNVMQRQSDTVGLANFAQTINVVGALVVSQDEVIRESVFWPLWMQRHHSGPVAVQSHLVGEQLECADRHGGRRTIPALDISTTRAEDRSRLWISVVNRDPDRAHDLDVAVVGAQVSGQAQCCELTAATVLTRNSAQEPEAVSPRWRKVDLAEQGTVRLAPASYTVIEVDLVPSA